MSVYTPHFAPVAVLAFLGTAALLILCFVVALIGAVGKSRTTVVGAIAAGLTILVGYAVVLFGISLFSKDVQISQGAWKYFCEIDCHIAYTVGGFEMVESAANERFAVVELKTWFDPMTISPNRGNGPLTPNGRTLVLLDDHGRKFAPSAKSEALLASRRLHSTPLREALRPGESYVSYVVFEVPPDARGLRLLLTSSDEEGFLIWDDESSPFHHKAYFALAKS
jgi:hypothetical protein